LKYFQFYFSIFIFHGPCLQLCIPFGHSSGSEILPVLPSTLHGVHGVRTTGRQLGRGDGQSEKASARKNKSQALERGGRGIMLKTKPIGETRGDRASEATVVG